MGGISNEGVVIRVVKLRAKYFQLTFFKICYNDLSLTNLLIYDRAQL